MRMHRIAVNLNVTTDIFLDLARRLPGKWCLNGFPSIDLAVAGAIIRRRDAACMYTCMNAM